MNEYGGCVHPKLLKSSPTLCNPMDNSLPGSFVHGILQAGTLEWAAVPSPGGLPDLGAGSSPLAPPEKPMEGTWD